MLSSLMGIENESLKTVALLVAAVGNVFAAVVLWRTLRRQAESGAPTLEIKMGREALVSNAHYLKLTVVNNGERYAHKVHVKVVLAYKTSEGLTVGITQERDIINPIEPGPFRDYTFDSIPCETANPDVLIGVKVSYNDPNGPKKPPELRILQIACGNTRDPYKREWFCEPSEDKARQMRSLLL